MRGGVMTKPFLRALFMWLCLLVGCSLLMNSVQNWTTRIVLVQTPALQDGTIQAATIPVRDGTERRQNLASRAQTGIDINPREDQGPQYGKSPQHAVEAGLKNQPQSVKAGNDPLQHPAPKVLLFPHADGRNQSKAKPDASPSRDGYTVYTPGCKIPKYNPFDNTIKHIVRKGTNIFCDRNYKAPRLLYQDGNWLRINHTALKLNNMTLDHCAFSAIRRKPQDDVNIEITGNNPFKTDIEMLTTEFIKVQCFVEQKTHSVYRNLFAFVIPKNRTQSNASSGKGRSTSGNKTRLSVIMLGLDSVSRLNSVRQLPKTRDYLLKKLGVFEMFGFNKVGDNTFVNLVPILTGKYVSELPYDLHTMARKYFDDYDIIWKKFADLGFATQFAEDSTYGSIFNYLRAGFKESPVDHYLRPFSIAMQGDKSLFHNGNDCFAGRLHTKIILDYLSDFVKVSSSHNTPFFALTFITFLTHDYLNKLGGADEVYLEFFESLKVQGHLENTAIFFFGDHGMRFGSIRNTYIGKMEGRIPMMYLYLPEWFRRKYPNVAENLNSNTGTLTTPFDIHETLRDILYMNGTTQILKPASVKKRGLSLFSRIPRERTCEHATIPPHWCACREQKTISSGSAIIKEVADQVLSYLNNETLPYRPECAKLKLHAIDKAYSTVIKEASNAGKKVSVVDYQVTMTTVPGMGRFEATIRHYESDDVFEGSGDVSRTNLYGNQSHCIDNFVVKKYCFCVDE